MTPHLFIIHFPVSLVLVAAVLEAAGAGLRDRVLRDWAWRMLLAGALAAFLAFVTGEGAMLAALSTPGIDLVRMEAHSQWGSVGTWGLLGAALLRSLWRHRLEGAFGIVNLALPWAASALVVAITLSGTAVRHGS